MSTWDSCDQWIERFLEGEFEKPSAEKEAFERHISSCSFCSKEYTEYCAIDAQIRALPVDEPPSTLSMLCTLLEEEEKQQRDLVPFTELVPLPQNGYSKARVSISLVGELRADMDSAIKEEVTSQLAQLQASDAKDRSLKEREQVHELEMRTRLGITSMISFVGLLLFCFIYVLIRGSLTEIIPLMFLAAMPAYVILGRYIGGIGVFSDLQKNKKSK